MRVLSLFSGIGAFEKALTNLGIDFELVGFSEIDKYASKSYCAIHNIDETKNLGDITKYTEWQLPTDIDLVTYGFPCGPKGTKIITQEGYKNIEEIQVGEKVLTHKNRYRKVVKTMNRISDHYYTIKAVGVPKLQLTEEHPLYVLRDGQFEWVKIKDLKMTDELTVNIPEKSKIANYSDEFLWMLGRYVADGYINKHNFNSVYFAIGVKKQKEFLETIPKEIRNKLTDRLRGNCYEYRVADKELKNICEMFGNGAKNKQIPRWIIDLPKEQLQHFFDGYIAGDGHKRVRGKVEQIMFTTVSESLFLGMQQIIAKLYGCVATCSIRQDSRKDSYSNTYNCQFSILDKRPKQHIVEDKICIAINSIKRENEEIDVYNFEVEEDNSYTCENVIVHNCQDISVAGKQKGFSDENGNKTRSGLFFEALEVIQKTMPKVAIAENVKALTSKKFAKEFETVLTSLEDAGYNNYWKVLNAKDYGIPQNRERVFIVSIRKDIDNGTFTFPHPAPLLKRLKDMLEQNVDEKYYLSNAAISFFTNNSQKQEKLGNGFRFSPTDGDCVGKTITTRAGSRMDDNFIKEPKVMTHNLKQIVSVRKYKVDCNSLVECLRSHKGEFTNKEIAERIGVPITMVEHWFRRDSSFAIPDATIWIRLKELLGIETDEFDEAIMTFETREGVYDKSNRAYGIDGISPTITSTDADVKIVQTPKERFFKQAIETAQENECEDGDTIDAFNKRVNQSGISPTLTTRPEGFKTAIPPIESCRIRKLTPKECWRLMGFDDEDHDKAEKAGVSNSQRYKQAGNSIVVSVAEAILYHLFQSVYGGIA